MSTGTPRKKEDPEDVATRLFGARPKKHVVAQTVDARIKPNSNLERVLHALQQGGKTDEELQQFLAMSPNTERPRRIELVDMGLVRSSGQRRLTKTGSKATVWEVIP